MRTEIFKIEKNIPIPAKKTGRKLKYPFNKMKVNHSFHAKTSSINLLAGAKSWASRSKLDWKFIARPEGKGARIWRTA